MADIREWAQRLQVEPLIARAISFNPSRLEPAWKVPVEFNFNLKSSSGRCVGGWEPRLELHPILGQAAQEAELISTFLHEVAHVLQRLEHKGNLALGQGHGAGWWEAMIRLGQAPWLASQRWHSIGREMKVWQQAAKSGQQFSDLDLEDLGI